MLFRSAQRWSFAVLLENEPEFLTAANHLAKNTNDKAEVTTRLIDRLGKWRSSPKHTQPEAEKDVLSHKIKSQAYKQLRILLEYAGNKNKEFKTYTFSDYIELFISSTIRQEMRLANDATNVDRSDLAAARQRVGWSMLCWYGLSPKREEHLAKPPPQTEELKHLWRVAGDYLREHYVWFENWPTNNSNVHARELAPETKEFLERLIKKYQEETGENLGLPS